MGMTALGAWRRGGLLTVLTFVLSPLLVSCSSIGDRAVTWTRQPGGAWTVDGDPGRIPLRVRLSQTQTRTGLNSASSIDGDGVVVRSLELSGAEVLPPEIVETLLHS